MRGVGAVIGGGSFDFKAYAVEDDTNTIYRFYDVRWHETIPPLEIDEGSSGTFDLTTISQDATSFEFAPSNTSRSWLSISGNDLVVTDAPNVVSDTDYDVVVRAVRGDFHDEITLTVRVIAERVVQVLPGSPTNVAVTPRHNISSC